MSTDWVPVPFLKIVNATEWAVLVKLREGVRLEWFPFSEMDDQIFQIGDGPGVLKVTEYLCKKKGIGVIDYSYKPSGGTGPICGQCGLPAPTDGMQFLHASLHSETWGYHGTLYQLPYALFERIGKLLEEYKKAQ
jgi:hypothetical protein